MKEQRKLAAIMFTDIVGYSALMSKDEKLALGVLEINRKIHKSAISKFNGQYIRESCRHPVNSDLKRLCTIQGIVEAERIIVLYILPNFLLLIYVLFLS